MKETLNFNIVKGEATIILRCPMKQTRKQITKKKSHYFDSRMVGLNDYIKTSPTTHAEEGSCLLQAGSFRGKTSF